MKYINTGPLHAVKRPTLRHYIKQSNPVNERLADKTVKKITQTRIWQTTTTTIYSIVHDTVRHPTTRSAGLSCSASTRPMTGRKYV